MLRRMLGQTLISIAVLAAMLSPMSRAQKGSDRAVMGAIFVVFCLWLIFMPLDARRFGWSHTPLWVQVLGAFLILVAYVGWGTVMKANSFASTEIRVQKERGQKVISALLGLVLILPLLAARALGEEAMLFAELPGYREYSEKVRFRLLPGLW